MKIAVFCSANDEIDPEYFRLTTQLGEWMAREGHTLVFGGCDSGLMECVARAVTRAGERSVSSHPSSSRADDAPVTSTSKYHAMTFPTASRCS